MIGARSKRSFNSCDRFADQMNVPLKGLEGEHAVYKLAWRESD